MAKKAPIEQTQIVKALRFLYLTWKAGEDQAMYSMFNEHKAVSFNSIIAAGTTIEEDLLACPHTALLLTAMEQCSAEYVISQLSPEKLLVRSGSFQAYIPCISANSLSWPVPDPPVTAIDDRLLEALRKVVPLLDTKAESVIEQSIQLNAGSCLSTNRAVILEAWHGIDLPSGLLLPKAIVTALDKSKKHLKAFGFSPVTATFYFSDDTWLRTQLFQATWPKGIAGHLNASSQGTRPVPPELFSAAKRVAPFSGDGYVWVNHDYISSHSFSAKEEGSELKLPIGSDHKQRIYFAKNLAMVAKHAIMWDEDARKDGTYFTGENIRGLIYHRIPNDHPDLDDDIPF